MLAAAADARVKKCPTGVGRPSQTKTKTNKQRKKRVPAATSSVLLLVPLLGGGGVRVRSGESVVVQVPVIGRYIVQLVQSLGKVNVHSQYLLFYSVITDITGVSLRNGGASNMNAIN